MGLAGALEAMSDEALGHLLRARPDLLHPPPTDFGQLASRAGAWRSVLACLDRLDRFTLQVIDVLCLLPEPASAENVLTLLGPPAEGDDVGRALDRLRSRGLVVIGEGAVRLTGTTRSQHPHPAHLGRPLATLLAGAHGARPGDICRALHLPAGGGKGACLGRIAAALGDLDTLSHLVASAPKPARDRLDAALDDGPVVHIGYQAWSGGYTSPDLEWLLARGLLVSTQWSNAEVPREVGLALRGGVAHVRTEPSRPRSGLRPVEPDDAHQAAAADADAAVRGVAAVLGALGGAPAPALKAGGLGVREAKRVAKAADLPEADAIRLLEIALAADLVVDAVPGHGVAPAPAFDGWMELPPAERWLALVRAWIDTPRWPSLAGQRDLNDKPIPALMPYGHGAAAAAQRRTLLDELARAPSGSSVDPATVVPSVTWEMPGAWETSPASPGRVIEWTLAEARLLGVTGLGALCTAARLLLDGRPDEATEAARHLLPTPSTEITLQADLTCIAPAALEATLRGELGLMADVESSGAATVFRFSETSIRRAIDAGRSGEQLVALLERHAPRGVPQPLAYLVADVARRHGQIRVGEVCSYLRCDDAALVAEVLRTKAKAVGALALRALAPTVLASKATPGELLDALRAAGFLPAREELGGELLLSRAEPHRANPRPPSSARRPVEPSDAELAAAVQALRRGRRDPPSLRDQLLLSRLARGQPPVEPFDGTDFDDVNDVDYVDYGAGDEPDDDGLDAEIINFLRRRH